MQTKINFELGPGPIPHRGPHCTRKQAKELLEGLCTAYRLLPPSEQTAIRGIVAQAAQTQLAQKHECKKVKAPGSCAESR